MNELLWGYIGGTIAITIMELAIWKQNPDLHLQANVRYRSSVLIGMLIVASFWPILLPILVLHKPNVKLGASIINGINTTNTNTNNSSSHDRSRLH